MDAFSDFVFFAAAVGAPPAHVFAVPGSVLGLVAGDLLALLGVICALVPAGIVIRAELRRLSASPKTVYRFPSDLAAPPASRAVGLR